MKKLTTLPLLAAGLLLAGSALHGASPSGTWFLIDAGGNNTLTATTADADTIAVSQPAAANNDVGAVTYLSSAVSLSNVGDFIQFSGDYSGDVGNNVNYAIRIGFFNSNGSSVTGNFSAASDSWIGLFAGSGNRSSTGAASNNFYQAANADKVLDAGDSSPETAIGGTDTAISTGARTITFRIEKTSATDLSLQLISGSVNHTDTLAIATAPSTTFDALAVSWKIGATTGARVAAFDNIVISTIPEPSTCALLGGFLAIVLVMLRRRMW